MSKTPAARCFYASCNAVDGVPAKPAKSMSPKAARAAYEADCKFWGQRPQRAGGSWNVRLWDADGKLLGANLDLEVELTVQYGV